jgi:hypothetical protein
MISGFKEKTMELWKDGKIERWKDVEVGGALSVK